MHDEEDYITALEISGPSWRRDLGAKDFFLGGDINIELNFDASSEDFGMAFVGLNAEEAARSPTRKSYVGCN